MRDTYEIRQHYEALARAKGTTAESLELEALFAFRALRLRDSLRKLGGRSLPLSRRAMGRKDKGAWLWQYHLVDAETFAAGGFSRERQSSGRDGLAALRLAILESKHVLDLVLESSPGTPRVEGGDGGQEKGSRTTSFRDGHRESSCPEGGEGRVA